MCLKSILDKGSKFVTTARNTASHGLQTLSVVVSTDVEAKNTLKLKSLEEQEASLQAKINKLKGK